RPLAQRATATVRRLHQIVEGRVPIIAAGGIMSGADAREKAAAGASLVQLYTGLIYRGPVLIREAAEALEMNRHRPSP
nr:quinone-dependent dihydroorotate dehydrogenase [Pseudomonadota bacterium]